MKEQVNYLRHLFRLYEYRKPTLAQFIKFCIVGGIGVIVNLAVLYSVVELARPFIQVDTFFILLASTIAFMAAVTSNFFLNKLWTFKKSERIRPEKGIWQYLKFTLVCLAGLGVNLVVLYLLIEFMHLWYILAQLLAIIVAVSVNFTGSKLWVFER